LARVITLFLCLIFIALPQSLAQASFPVDYQENAQVMGTCPPVQNTPFFTIAYGTVTVNGSNAPIGSVVKAWSPRNDLVGCFVVSSTGNYGAMYIYGEDTSVIPSIPGMRVNEPVAFTINDIPATSTPSLLWANDKDLHAINLASLGVSADFSATPVSGVFPLVVQFSDASTGSITSWLWNFGDGQTSTEQNPQHMYSAAGSYSVSLTVNGPSGSDIETKTDYVNVYTPVSANFSANQTSGIAPLSVTFTNNSTGDYTSTNWTFGDGGTSSSINPVYVYATGGTYPVSLIVSGPGGEDTETKTNYITVYTPVTASFSATPTSGIAPLTVSFTNTSSGDYTSLSWNFGDGNTSTDTNPTHEFATPGNFTVTLTASGPGGTDIETYTDYITVYQAVNAEFSADLTSGIAPLEVHFTNLSTGDYATLSWDFGDGGTSTDINPTHVFSAGGAFTVALTASGDGGTDQETKTAYISIYSPVTADFTYSPANGIAPLTVQFTNTSSGDYDTLAWNFGDGSPVSNEIDPEHVFEAGGTYIVTLTASGTGGQGIQTHSIEVFVPVEAAFSTNVTSGVAPLSVEFTNQSSGDFDTIAWDFGDLNSSNLPNPIHTYETPGIYTVTLTVSGPGGNDVETKTDYIVIYEPAVADFSADTLSGIAPYAISFTDQSVGDYDTWLWNFGDGNTSGEASPQHQYISPGIYTVSLTVSGNGGSNTETKTDYITIYEPITVDFYAEPINGIVPLDVTFTANIVGDFNAVSWDFGDGNTSSENTPNHTYMNPGSYTVSLTASGNGGSNSITKINYITVYPLNRFIYLPLIIR